MSYRYKEFQRSILEDLPEWSLNAVREYFSESRAHYLGFEKEHWDYIKPVFCRDGMKASWYILSKYSDSQIKSFLINLLAMKDIEHNEHNSSAYDTLHKKNANKLEQYQKSLFKLRQDIDSLLMSAGSSSEANQMKRSWSAINKKIDEKIARFTLLDEQASNKADFDRQVMLPFSHDTGKTKGKKAKEIRALRSLSIHSHLAFGKIENKFIAEVVNELYSSTFIPEDVSNYNRGVRNNIKSMDYFVDIMNANLCEY